MLHSTNPFTGKSLVLTPRQKKEALTEFITNAWTQMKSCVRERPVTPALANIVPTHALQSGVVQLQLCRAGWLPTDFIQSV